MLLLLTRAGGVAVVAGPPALIRYIHFPGETVYPGDHAYPEGFRSDSGAMPFGDPRRRIGMRGPSVKRIHLRRSS